MKTNSQTGSKLGHVTKSSVWDSCDWIPLVIAVVQSGLQGRTGVVVTGLAWVVLLVAKPRVTSVVVVGFASWLSRLQKAHSYRTCMCMPSGGSCGFGETTIVITSVDRAIAVGDGWWILSCPRPWSHIPSFLAAQRGNRPGSHRRLRLPKRPAEKAACLCPKRPKTWRLAPALSEALSLRLVGDNVTAPCCRQYSEPLYEFIHGRPAFASTGSVGHTRRIHSKSSLTRRRGLMNSPATRAFHHPFRTSRTRSSQWSLVTSPAFPTELDLILPVASHSGPASCGVRRSATTAASLKRKLPQVLNHGMSFLGSSLTFNIAAPGALPARTPMQDQKHNAVRITCTPCPG